MRARPGGGWQCSEGNWWVEFMQETGNTTRKIISVNGGSKPLSPNTGLRDLGLNSGSATYWLCSPHAELLFAHLRDGSNHSSYLIGLLAMMQ